MPCSVNMYFGERFINGQFKVYMSDGLPVEVLDFDCTVISIALGLSFTEFKLTEKELLATASFNAWLQYGATSRDNDILVVKIFKELFGPDGFADLVAISARTLTCILEQKDASGLNEIISKFGVQETAEQFIKLEQAYEWLRSIHGEFYGKKYLVQVGDQTSGVCIKDKFGNRPNFDLKVEAEGGLFYTSDMPASAGAWPNPGVTQILGLNIGSETFLFQESDNRIGAFVKIDEYENLQRFGLNWEIDLSQVSDDSFYIKNGSLYLKAEVSEVLYELSGKQYVLVDLSNAPLLRLTLGADDCQSNLLAQGAQSLLILFGDAESEDKPFKDALNKVFCDNKDGDLRGVPHNRPAFNVLNSNKPTIIPDSFVIPARSNIFVYGPWFFQANPVGGTIVESNKDLCPWKFSNGYDDGYNRMNIYGRLIAYDGPRGLQKQESGSITVASLPSYNIGFVVGANAATLTDININIGDNGFTTTYNFQTYTPKFGSPGRQLAELWSRSYKSLSYINKFFKDQKIEIEKLVNKNRQGLQKKLGNKLNNKKIHVDAGEINAEDKMLVPASKSPGFLLMSGYFFEDYNQNATGGSDTSSTNGLDRGCSRCTTVTYPPASIGGASASSPGNVLQNRPFSVLDKGHTWEYVREHTYTRLAISTLDLILSPICNKQISDIDIPNDPLPRLALYEDAEFAYKPELVNPGDPPRSKPSNVIPPFYINEELVYDLPIHQMYLNNVTSKQMLNYWDNRQNGSTKGFITHLISFGSSFKEFNLTITEDDEDNRQNHDIFRYAALRGPLTLQSWGYDTSGKPVPNAVDSAIDCERGQFRKGGLKDKFLRDWLNNPKTWPIGPIDLRWDRERGVWVAPPSNKIVLARLESSLGPFESAQAELLNTKADGLAFYQNYDIWGPDGEDVKAGINTAKIKVYDYLGRNYCKCDVVYAYYDDNKYIILESSSFNPDQCCETTTTTTATPPPPPPTPPPPPPATIDCWCGLECLKTITNYKRGFHQALVHKTVGLTDCLFWEDIVPCVPSTPGVDSPTDFIEDNDTITGMGNDTVPGVTTEAFASDGESSTLIELGNIALNINPTNNITTDDILAMLSATATVVEVIGEDQEPSGDLAISIYWTFDSSPFTFDYLAVGETASLGYIIDIVDSNNASLLLEPYEVTITITGTDEGVVIIDLTENGESEDLEYLSATGLLSYTDLPAGGYTISSELTNIDTNTSRTYDYIRQNDEVPSDEDLAYFLRSSQILLTYSSDDYKIYTWTWDASQNSQSSSFDGFTFDYLAVGEYMNLTYTITLTGPGGYEESRDITINITGRNDGPVIPTATQFNNMSNNSLLYGERRYYHGASTNITIIDLDHSDGNIAARVVGISNLDVSQNPDILGYPEWPGLAGLKEAISLSFSSPISPQKEPFDHNSDDSLPDTVAILTVKFNNGSVSEATEGMIDFSFVPENYEFSFDINVEVTDAIGASSTFTSPVRFSGWCDGNTVTHELNGNASSLESDKTIVAENNTSNSPHRININSSDEVIITLDRTDNSGNDIYAFYDIRMNSLDRNGPILYSDSGVGFLTTDYEALGWDTNNIPDVYYAYNLSNSDKLDPSKYTSTTIQDSTINGVPLKRNGELTSTINVMVKIPYGALSETWAGEGVTKPQLKVSQGYPEMTSITPMQIQTDTSSTDGVVDLVIFIADTADPWIS